MLALTGTPAVLLTRSNLLRQSLAALVHALGPADGSVRVATAHSWLAEWCGSTAPRRADGWYDWHAFFERAAATAPAPGPTLGVDEGQDLPPEFYRLCRLLQARTTVYADECQRLTTTNSTLAEIIQRLGMCTRHELYGNHRNTHQIAAFAAQFRTDAGMPAVPEREGPPSRLHRLPDRGAADLLILLAERHPKQSIGVVVNSARTQFSLLGSLERRARGAIRTRASGAGGTTARLITPRTSTKTPGSSGVFAFVGPWSDQPREQRPARERTPGPSPSGHGPHPSSLAARVAAL